MSQRSQRKEEHLALAKMFFNKQKNSDFHQVHLIRPALPETKFDNQSLNTQLFNHQISMPIYVNAMTGGSEKSYQINKRLAKACAKENIPMALGSASILEKEPEQLNSFIVARNENPDGLIFANVNPDTSPESAKEIVATLQADALQIHLNTVQEAVMPEGDRNFVWLDNLKRIREELDVPIIIKEVGQGLDPATINILIKNAFTNLDLGGSGGTNFAQIENERRKHHDLAFLEDIGLSTPKALLASKIVKQKATIFASGGINNSLDIFKSLVLGANYVGLASHFLKFAFLGSNELCQEIEKIKSELIMLNALYGINHIKDARKVKYYLDTDLYTYLKQIKSMY
ncbi:type 2 isopentenyl-diphosphate Delta-isomerase [Lactobacillus hominis]|uniref:Isopentenyl-diphosphate delta-isomerase n=1 Tax=Lactobacillus hominis DSM 23910 = CRBIP 24.179 TaxID=1423758 RepID=I7JVB9_9LACO|nr:type 2 isopentenyl-diphosphate Delta-isomerase [Lactobacillus hominis]KRM85050.1 isopentenyl pyrophosphate isomerase [Lactobacillus hominis DSM 23910 = CRBIP 24.179]MCT3348449.1 type 2 isopentenyl-diphosphate Delta-isomerase [Lactobacillus hominis]CCI82566.1 Isopentenyl-diphosphate delta-isomerase [Lactobacillus hominis DSM 23910 = CRBIP 24.179]